jgi:predicted nucleic acid-binding protein
MVLIDTSVWIDADHQSDSETARELRNLIAMDEAAITDIVLAEILQGAGSEEHFDRLIGELEPLTPLHADHEAWLLAARLSNDLRRSGQATPLSDVLVAAVALRADVPVFATDRHFRRIPALRLHEVGA